MKRILMMVLRNIILVPFMWCKLCYHAHHVDKYTEEEHYKDAEVYCPQSKQRRKCDNSG